jgi:protein required for attachment to host cells
MEQTDLHTQSEERFLRALAGNLNAAVQAGQIQSLIVIAPPRALGVLRQAYSASLRNVLRAEVDKDLVRLPVHEIEKHLVR